MTQLLELTGQYELEVARNGVEGIEKVRAWQPDLILMGLRMPGMGGFETIETIRRNPNSTGTPIIVISPWASAKHKARTLAAGANEHLTPPVDAGRLLRKINRYLEKKTSSPGQN